MLAGSSAKIQGSEGVYIDKNDIFLIEPFDYQAVVDAANNRSKANEVLASERSEDQHHDADPSANRGRQGAECHGDATDSDDQGAAEGRQDAFGDQERLDA